MKQALSFFSVNSRRVVRFWDLLECFWFTTKMLEWSFQNLFSIIFGIYFDALRHTLSWFATFDLWWTSEDPYFWVTTLASISDYFVSSHTVELRMISHPRKRFWAKRSQFFCSSKTLDCFLLSIGKLMPFFELRLH